MWVGGLPFSIPVLWISLYFPLTSLPFLFLSLQPRHILVSEVDGCACICTYVWILHYPLKRECWCRRQTGKSKVITAPSSLTLPFSSLSLCTCVYVSACRGSMYMQFIALIEALHQSQCTFWLQAHVHAFIPEKASVSVCVCVHALSVPLGTSVCLCVCGWRCIEETQASVVRHFNITIDVR